LLFGLWACSYSYIALLPQFARGYGSREVSYWSEQHNAFSRAVVGVVCFVTTGGRLSPDDVRSLNDVDGIPAIILVTSLVIATALLVNLWLEFRRRLGLSPKLSGPVGLGIAVVTVVTVFLNYEKVTTLLLNGLKYFA
jgi:hypothetical protein